MTAAKRDVTKAELAVLEKLWEHGVATLKQLSKWLYAGDTPSNVATVQKLITRLENKGFVARDRSFWPHRFHAVADRERLVALRLQAAADDLCDGSLATLLMQAVKSTKFSPRQRKRLRKLLDELDED